MKRSLLRSVSVFSGAVGSMLWAMPTTLAQTSNAEPARTSIGLEEVIVTAQRREQTAQSVPIAITAFTANRLQELGADTTRSLQLFTPGLVIGQVSSAQVTLRGVSTSNLNLSGDPGVGVYVDDIYIARASGAFQDFFDTERVEVLRGPQGTLFGRNTPGGVIAIHNVEPSNELGGYFEATYGSRNRIRVEGAANVPLIDDVLAIRFAGVSENRSGFMVNLFDDSRVDDKELAGFRVSLKYTPSAAFKVLLRAEYLKDEGTGSPFKAFTPGLANNLGGFSPIDQEQAVNIDEPLTKNNRNKGVSLRIDWNFAEDWTLTSITGVREHTTADTGDLDDTELSTALFNNDSFSRTWQQEFQITSSAIEDFEWIAGAFLWWEEGDLTLDFPFPVFGIRPLTVSQIDTSSIAGFAQGSYYLLDKLRFTAGIRWTKDKKDFQRDFSLIPFIFNDIATSERNDSAWTPRFGIDYFVQEDVMLYFNATRGFKSGGFNAAGIQPNYAPEFLWSYEGGLKSSWFDRRLQVNIAGFYYDYNDLQALRIVQVGSAIDNASSGTVKGVDVEINAIPVEGLSLFFGASYLRAKYSEYITTNDLTGLPADLSGNFFPRSPKFSFSTSADYSFPITADHQIVLHGDLQYKDGMFFDQFNRDFVAEDSTTVINARVTLEGIDGRWSVAVFGRNLTDAFYAENKFAIAESGGTVLGVVAPPRRWGVEVAFRF